jgi:hypothetical protein
MRISDKPLYAARPLQAIATLVRLATKWVAPYRWSAFSRLSTTLPRMELPTRVSRILAFSVLFLLVLFVIALRSKGVLLEPQTQLAIVDFG